MSRGTTDTGTGDVGTADAETGDVDAADAGTREGTGEDIAAFNNTAA
ncbi:hypothetical protein ACIO8G_15245 [Streptomyces sp. NPDC087219]